MQQLNFIPESSASTRRRPTTNKADAARKQVAKQTTEFFDDCGMPEAGRTEQ